MTRLATAFEALLPWIRSQFPQLLLLRDGTHRIYLDNAAGTLVPQSVADAMAQAALWRNPQPDRDWPSGRATGDEQRRLRASLREFMNARDEDAVFVSESTTASLLKLRLALEGSLRRGDRILVTDCDHFANISPWEWRARERGLELLRVPMRHDGGLDPGTFAERLNSRTRVAALTLAGNGLGTLVSVPELVREVRRCSPDALVVLDAVHAAPHVPLDVAALGVDVLAFSTYKLFGPMAGVLWVSEDAGKRLSWYHVAPHTAQQSRAELGTLNTSTVAGTLAGLEYLRGIGERLEPHAVGLCAGLPRERRKLRLAMEAIRGYEQALSLRLLGGMTDLPGLKLHGVTDPARVADRVPTVAFTLQGVPATEYERLLWEVGGIQIGSGSHYSGAVLRGLGVEGVGRASFAHYNSRGDTEALIQALDAARRVGQNRR